MQLLWPDVIFLSVLGLSVLRIVTGLVMLGIGLEHFFEKRNGISRNASVVLSFFELVTAGLLILGAFTQVAGVLLALLALFYSVRAFLARSVLERHAFVHLVMLHILLFALGLFFIVSGPGLIGLEAPF